jgi:catechol 2,3-dioxygenase-like lactoylglutathione lyase family enzyme
MIETRGLTHIHLMVRDLDRSLAFYRRVFGLDERFREGRHMVFLNTPGSQDLITLNADPSEADVAGTNGGVNHFGFRLSKGSDMDIAAREVEAAGGTIVKRGEHAPGAPFLYIRDPDGYLIELLL